MNKNLPYRILSLTLTTTLILSSALGALSDRERTIAFETIVEKDFREIPKNLRHWLDEQEESLDNPSDISADYEQIKEMVSKISKYIKKPSTIGSKKENIPKNAHQQFPPIDATRTLRHLKNYYLSANDVLTPLQEYIVSQAPLESTIPDFWRAVLEVRSPTILTLSMPTDAKRDTPAYWDKSRFPLSIGDWKLEETGEAEVLDVSADIPSQRFVKRVITATNAISKESWTIQHLHYENWPDNGAPDPQLFFRILNLVTKLHPQSTAPLVVHCSAGLGRSGTFVTAHSLIKEIGQLNLKTVNIPKRIIELRMQRAYLVSTVVQFAAIYEAIRHCARDLSEK